MTETRSDKRGKEKGNIPSKPAKFFRVLNVYSLTIIVGMLSIGAVNFFNTSYKSNSESSQSVKCLEQPKYWGVCIDHWNINGNLRTMDRVFNRLGFVPVNGSNGDDWDILWTIEYPYHHPQIKRSEQYDTLDNPLKFHQRINRIPGFNFIAAKSFMTSNNRDIKYVLPGFFFPAMIDDFKTYVKANPHARFVEKALGNRGVRLVEKDEINFKETNKYYQHFMENPFLVDGRFMDFGVFALISSIEPLRVYRYAQEVHLRFCPEPYYPLDTTNLDKYVISGSRLDFMRLPETKFYFDEYGFSFKLSIEDYFERKGHNVTELWRKIDEAIVQLVVNNEHRMVKETFKYYNSSHHFFEFFRFDFILNEDLEPHITEVNMSPSVTPYSDIGERITQTFEQLVHEAVQLVGAGSKLDLMSHSDYLTDLMLSHSKNIAVDPKTCVDSSCNQYCDKTECELCLPCVNKADLSNMNRAYREHVRRGGFKRLFPSKIHFDENYISKATPRNKISIKWFKEKCEENSEWC